MSIAFMLCGEAEHIVLSELSAEIQSLRADQIAHVEHLLRSWRVPQGMLWQAAIKCVRKAIRRTLNDRP